MEQLAWSERQNIDTSDRCVRDWFIYGINPNDVTEENLKVNYVEMVKRYGNKIMFILVVFAFSTLKNRFGLQISNNFCRHMLTRMQDMDNLQYRNPYLLILGLWITNSDGSVNIERFENGITIMGEIDDYKISGPDLLRYHNFWNNV